MASAGDTIQGDNFKVTMVRTSADTNGALVEVEAVYGPRSQPPPRHYHPNQEEEFRILEGQLIFELAGEKRVVEAGSALIVPTRAIHMAWNPGDTPTRATWITRPALGTERVFEAMGAIARARAEGRNPNLLELALFAREFKDEFVLARPPRVVQSCVFGMLAMIARALGVRRPGS